MRIDLQRLLRSVSPPQVRCPLPTGQSPELYCVSAELGSMRSAFGRLPPSSRLIDPIGRRHAPATHACMTARARSRRPVPRHLQRRPRGDLVTEQHQGEIFVQHRRAGKYHQGRPCTASSLRQSGIRIAGAHRKERTTALPVKQSSRDVPRIKNVARAILPDSRLTEAKEASSGRHIVAATLAVTNPHTLGKGAPRRLPKPRANSRSPLPSRELPLP